MSNAFAFAARLPLEDAPDLLSSHHHSQISFVLMITSIILRTELIQRRRCIGSMLHSQHFGRSKELNPGKF